LTARLAPGDTRLDVTRLFALLLASALAGNAARGAEPVCEEVAAAAVHDAAATHEEPADGCGDCGQACLDCGCCRAPLAVAPRVARPAAPVAFAAVTLVGPRLAGLRPRCDVFQPPRA
jgi:hypothetical protein